MSGALLIAGTTSDAGKSLLTAGVCRWLHRQGVKVAPFKAQNMSNNSVVAHDGGEIGRAQALQAAACGLPPSVRFNPVLLKPGSDRRSQVVVLGQVVGEVSATSYRDVKAGLFDTVIDTLTSLRRDYDAVICEGAGSPAEINLRATDIANMGLARAARLPVLVVGDIDRGGVFAALFGTLALLSEADQQLVAGFVINKFRGDPQLLGPGLQMLTQLTGRPVIGTVPWLDGLWLDAEDSLSARTDGQIGQPAPPLGTQWLQVAAVRLPRISNFTDLDALAVEPGVSVRLVDDPAAIAAADLVVLPGSKSTVDDLAWLRERGLAEAITERAAAGRPVLGICGGYQMLAQTIDDPVESGAGRVEGLGVLPVRIAFAREKVLASPAGHAYEALPVEGYEIHHGRESWRDPELEPLFRLPDGGAEGASRGAVQGTHWHGAFESDEFRRAFLTRVAHAAGRTGFRVAADTNYAAVRAAALDVLGDAVAEHLDTRALLRLIDEGPPAGLPFVPPGEPRASAWHPHERQR